MEPIRSRPARRNGFWTRTRALALLFAALFLAGAAIYGIYLASGLPSLEQLENPQPELATKIYSYDGEVLDRIFVKNRTQVTIVELPTDLVNALVATEDKNFYDHWGVDAPRFLRAMVKNVLTLQLREGASTITQQLARNLYDLKGVNESLFGKISRKLREFVTAVQIERNYTKEEIIEMYLSVSYFGRSAYGLSSASQIYFGKEPLGLTLEESALLIGMLKGPGTYDPFRRPNRALQRRNTVLSQMVKYGYINEEQETETRSKPLLLRSVEEMRQTGIAPHFVEWIRQQLVQKAEVYGFDLYRDGLSVYTTLDSRMQRAANQAVEEHLAEYQQKFDKQWNWNTRQSELSQALAAAIRTSDAYVDARPEKRDSVARALRHTPAFVDSIKKAAASVEVGFVAVDHRDGSIRAMVGGSNYKNFKYGLNHVTQIRRQPGSAFKPFVYTVAIDNGYAPSFELMNQPITLMMADGSRWTPSNFDNTFGGKYTLREGLKHSINLIAIRAIMEIAPVQQVIEYAHRMGIKSELPPYESLAIGTGEVQPLELTAAYGVFANDGIYVEPYPIMKIEDKDGNTIEENKPLRREVLSPETAFLMTSMLQGNINGGTGGRVRNFYLLPAAGKTGTTQEYADAWFVGYTPHLSAGVWVGFDNRSVHFNNADGQGGRAAAPIWGRFMKYVYDDPEVGMPLDDFSMPNGIERDTICVETKKVATEYCPERTVEYFNKKYPPGACTIHTSWRWRDEQGTKNSITF